MPARRRRDSSAQDASSPESSPTARSTSKARTSPRTRSVSRTPKTRTLAKKASPQAVKRATVVPKTQQWSRMRDDKDMQEIEHKLKPVWAKLFRLAINIGDYFWWYVPFDLVLLPTIWAVHRVSESLIVALLTTVVYPNWETFSGSASFPKPTTWLLDGWTNEFGQIVPSEHHWLRIAMHVLEVWLDVRLGQQNTQGWTRRSLSLAAILRGPALFLLRTFYPGQQLALLSLSAETALLALTCFYTRYIKIVLDAVFRIKEHAALDETRPMPFLAERGINVYATFFASLIYGLVVTFSLRTFMPSVFIDYFYGLETISFAHEVSLVSILPATLIFGTATTYLISDTTLRESETELAEPASESYGLKTHTRVILRKTAYLSILVFISNIGALYPMFHQAVDIRGLATWAGVWAAAMFGSGLSLAAITAV